MSIHINKDQINSQPLNNSLNQSSSLNHSFNVLLAQELGVCEAIVIHHLQFWISFNRNRNKHFHEGRTWMYQTQEDMCACLPYFSYKQIRTIIDSLVKNEILIKGNFSDNHLDRTSWYAFKDENKFIGIPIQKVKKQEDSKNVYDPPKWANRSAQMGESPPIRALINMTDNKTTDTVCNAPPDGGQNEEILKEVKKIKKNSFNGTFIEISLSEIFSCAVLAKKDWKTCEIREAWDILEKYDGIVSDGMKFIEGTIKNLRNKEKSKWNQKQPLKKKSLETFSPSVSVNVTPMRRSIIELMQEIQD